MSDQAQLEIESLLDQVFNDLGIPRETDVTRFDSVVALAEFAFRQYAERPAFTSLGCTLSYADLDVLSANFAAWLQRHTNLVPGDRVAVQMPNLVQYPVVVLGALRAGMVVVNTNPLYSARELKHQLNDAGVKALVVQANVADTVARILPETNVEHVLVTELADLHSPVKRLVINSVAKYVKKIVPEFDIPSAGGLVSALRQGAAQDFKSGTLERSALAMLQYTGGTTGVAKGAMLSHGNLVSNVLQADALFESYGLAANEYVIAQPLPVYHIYAFMTCIYTMLRGGHMVFIPNPRDLSSVVKTLKDYEPNIFCGLNSLFVTLCNNESFTKLNFSSLRLTLSGGMALTHAAANQWHQVTGCEVSEGYGLTETSPVVSSNPGSRRIIGTIGLPVPNTEVKIVDDAGVAQAVEQAGELCVRGPQVMLGYWQRSDETVKVLDDQGWFYTGDIVKIRADGFLQIVDRKKDMIVVSGFNVYPNEIEDVLYEHDDVLECAAVGVADETSGELIKMFVVSRSGELTEEKVREFCRRSLTAYKVPRLVEFRSELPKTNVGKILRRELRDNP